ncbi:MAG TPA: DUF5777 family beta-barrel protein [Vicinamibacterales bacterium]
MPGGTVLALLGGMITAHHAYRSALVLSLFTLLALSQSGVRLAAQTAGATTAPVKTFHVVARQYAFDPSQIEVTQGDVVRLIVTSADVTHGLAIPEFGVNLDVPTGGQAVTTEFTANAVGTFDIGCSEFCGMGHERMHATLIVRAKDGATSQTAAGAKPARPRSAADLQDLSMKPSQPDFTVIDLPTTLRLPVHASAVRVTHRFVRALNSGGVGSLASDFFGLDSGAQIGLEYRFGLARGTQLGVYRTSDRDIQLFGQYDVLRRAAPRRIGVNVVVSVDGQNNFRQDYSPGAGVVVSAVGSHGAVYAMPMFVGNTNPGALASDHQQTAFVGLGGRLRVRPTLYLDAEISPRLAGYRPGDALMSVAIEARVGGHEFQLNASNGFATTYDQIARGGPAGHGWFLGFNITRKMY